MDPGAYGPQKLVGDYGCAQPKHLIQAKKKLNTNWYPLTFIHINKKEYKIATGQRVDAHQGLYLKNIPLVHLYSNFCLKKKQEFDTQLKKWLTIFFLKTECNPDFAIKSIINKPWQNN